MNIYEYIPLSNLIYIYYIYIYMYIYTIYTIYISMYIYIHYIYIYIFVETHTYNGHTGFKFMWSFPAGFTSRNGLHNYEHDLNHW